MDGDRRGQEEEAGAERTEDLDKLRMLALFLAQLCGPLHSGL